MLKLPIFLFLAISLMSSQADAYSAYKLEQMSRKALAHLLKTNPKARAISEHSLAVLVFPAVIKAGFMAGVQRGDGVLFKDGAVAGYYNTTAASYGYQAGIQKFAYTLFFMDQNSLKYLKKSDGFELGGAPTLVVADAGFTAAASTTTLQKGICAFFFDQKGLMAGIGIQGTKITRFTPSK